MNISARWRAVIASATVVAVAGGLAWLGPGGTAGALSSAPAADTPPAERPRLTWGPPALTDPTTIKVTNRNRDLRLSTSRDYRILLPGAVGNDKQSTPLQADGGLKVTGGRNVTIIGGVIRHDVNYASRDGCTGTEKCPKGQSRAQRMRAMYLLAWTGTMHIEGVEIAGRELWEGVNISTTAPNAVLQVQNVRFAERMRDPVLFSSSAGDHDGTDVLQTWNGPRVLRVDRLSVVGSPYQALWLEPTKLGAPTPTSYDIRRVDITVVGRHGYNIIKRGPDSTAQFPVRLSDVWVSITNGRRLESLVRPGTKQNAVYTGSDSRGRYVAWKPSWKISGRVYEGPPPGGSFVPAGTVGAGYRTPGYGR